MSAASYTTEFLPEVGFGRPNTVQEHFVQMMEAGLPGFVVRAAGTELHVVTAQLQACIAPEYVLGRPVQGNQELGKPLRRSAGSSPHDFYLHADEDLPFRGDEERVNVHLTTEGTVVASLFKAKPAARGWRFARWGWVNYNETHVDDSAVEPTEHRAEIGERDTLVFTSRLHAHVFRSVSDPRRSALDVFHVANRPGFDASK